MLAILAGASLSGVDKHHGDCVRVCAQMCLFSCLDYDERPESFSLCNKFCRHINKRKTRSVRPTGNSSGSFLLVIMSWDVQPCLAFDEAYSLFCRQFGGQGWLRYNLVLGRDYFALHARGSKPINWLRVERRVSREVGQALTNVFAGDTNNRRRDSGGEDDNKLVSNLGRDLFWGTDQGDAGSKWGPSRWERAHGSVLDTTSGSRKACPLWSCADRPCRLAVVFALTTNRSVIGSVPFSLLVRVIVGTRDRLSPAVRHVDLVNL
ncbi:unnamed protein product [Protopolystoma xenopodis]|uniref:Uncharacterized protein n=1 Tax=Protopolystoma xenopodis TaxID=117903 RepID=A0A448WFT4_9PLAT|nr:unnamed protein product [Protopolystoma xenopodis]